MTTPPDRQTNWTTIAESRFPWERDALEFVRARFPTHEPYRAWSNFEFVAEDGSVNEVDLLVFTPQGFFLVEIKSRPGRLSGDAGAWTWQTDGRLSTVDSPLFAANAKARRLRSLLQRQQACRDRERIPFVEALVFCSDPGLQCDLSGTATIRVCLRDRDAERERLERPGIMAAVKRRECPGLDPDPRGTHDRVMARVIGQAMEQAGVRPTQRTVSDYQLERLIDEGPGYQDWEAHHVRLSHMKKRVRLYLVRTEASADDRRTIERAALREYQLMGILEHPGVLKAYALTEGELGPALVLDHDARAVRLDHYLAQQNGRLDINTQLHLVRQIAEVVAFAHEKRVVPRALCPQSILVWNPDSRLPEIKIADWQVGSRRAGGTSGASREVTPTAHAEQLIESVSRVYLAPEALVSDTAVGEHLDVFSLGAIAYHIFSGEAPAVSALELSAKLRASKGLPISSVLDGAGEKLQHLIQYSTHPEVLNRTDSAADFLRDLDAFEEDLTSPDHGAVDDPAQAQMDDRLSGGFTVRRRLGQGASAVALLVERDRQEFVMKAANSADLNPRVAAESEVLDQLRHPRIVEHQGAVRVGDREAFLLRPVLVDRDEKKIETLGQRLRREGPLHIELLQRFGDDLLDAVCYLEEKGIPHRDIKPDNIVLGKMGPADQLHAVLFDFSLSRAPVEAIRAGTAGYVDPFLSLRNPPRWDLHAERYAAAVTLYELATGGHPQWGDGLTDPAQLDVEATVDADRFDASVRDALAPFFQRAFRREIERRFDNAEEMRREWRRSFEGTEQRPGQTDHATEMERQAALDRAELTTGIVELKLGARAVEALHRVDVLTVRNLLLTPTRSLRQLRGVGNPTRREIVDAAKVLRARLGTPGTEGIDALPEAEDVGAPSVDRLLPCVIFPGSRDGTTRLALQRLLGLEGSTGAIWPSQSEVARLLGVTPGRISQIAAGLEARWSREPAMTGLRSRMADILDEAGGVMTAAQMAEAVLIARGSVEEEPERTRRALSVVRAGLEVEQHTKQPRFLIQRSGDRVFVAASRDLADYAARLGQRADNLAGEDPLAPPGRVLLQLRTVALPPGAPPLPDTRLLRLAVASSTRAALSSRQELYPRGMPASRALKLSQGALYGVRTLAADQIRERVDSRYPDADRLPGRPALDDLLHQAGIDLRWDPNAVAAGGSESGAYVGRSRDRLSLTDTSASRSRTGGVPEADGSVLSDEGAEARLFDDRLRRSIKDGAFLAVLARPKHYERACSALARRFPVEMVDLEGLILDALREAGEKARVRWDLVIRTDATPHQGDWSKLMLLVGRAMSRVEQDLVSRGKPLLLIYPGLLARYDRMDLLERIRDGVGRPGGVPAAWVLVPDAQSAQVDGKVIPLLSHGQQARIPEGWLHDG